MNEKQFWEKMDKRSLSYYEKKLEEAEQSFEMKLARMKRVQKNKPKKAKKTVRKKRKKASRINRNILQPAFLSKAHKRNKTKVVGVCYIEKINKSGEVTGYFRAYWNPEKGVQKYKNFKAVDFKPIRASSSLSWWA